MFYVCIFFVVWCVLCVVYCVLWVVCCVLCVVCCVLCVMCYLLHLLRVAFVAFVACVKIKNSNSRNAGHKSVAHLSSGDVSFRLLLLFGDRADSCEKRLPTIWRILMLELVGGAMTH